MGRHIRNGVPYGGTVNDSRMVKHKDTTVFEAIEDTNSNLSDYDLTKTSLPTNTSFKEMIQKLIEKNFPKLLQLINKDVVAWSGDGHYTTSGSFQNEKAWASGTSTSISPTFDITNYSSIKINASLDQSSGSSSIKLYKGETSVLTLVSHDGAQSGIQTIDVTKDVSNIEGNCTIRITNTSPNTGSICSYTVTSILLE